MIIENFITWFMKQTSGQYLNFAELDNITLPDAPADPIQLYVHIPFCSRLCPYCSFHRVAFDEKLTRDYFAALRKELKIYHALGFKFSGVYMGGGTPTVLMDELMQTLQLIQDLFSPGDISVETNPDRLEPEMIKSLADMGVKRVSVGIQTFDDGMLKMLDRYDKYGSGAELVEKLNACKGYVQTLNADMIYNFPIQTREMLERDLRCLQEVGPDQITFYPLMISDATRKEMERLMGPHSYRKEKLFNSIINEELGGEYQHGSAWCYSRKGSAMIDEYIVENNEYAGVGSGAFGLVGGSIYANTFSIPDYIREINAGQLPLKKKKTFSRIELLRYSFLMDLFGLKMERAEFRQRFGKDIWRLMPLEATFFSMVGGIRIDKDSITLTERGQYYWVIMMREFFTGVDNFRDISRAAVGIEPSFKR